MGEERKIIGLAGPIAAGKDVIAHYLKEQSFSEINVDKVGHIALDDSKDEVLSLFGQVAKQRNIDLLSKDGTLNRASLAKLVFENKKNLKSHEAILHPKMNEIIRKELQENPGKNYIINAAILHKFDVIKDCNMVIYITANPFLRYKRAKLRSNISKVQFFKTFLSQIEIYSKCKKLNADIYRVDNSETQERLIKKIERILSSC